MNKDIECNILVHRKIENAFGAINSGMLFKSYDIPKPYPKDIKIADLLPRLRKYRCQLELIEDYRLVKVKITPLN